METMRTVERKMVALGAAGVGKSSIILRHLGKIGPQSNAVPTTIAPSFFTWTVDLDNARVKLQVWDTAGQEKFRSMAPIYYRRTNAAMLVFDLADYASFAAVKCWVLELRQNVEGPVIFALIGNKSDLKEKRTVGEIEARRYAREISASYHETSIFEEEGIKIVFQTMAKRLVQQEDFTDFNRANALQVATYSPGTGINSSWGYCYC